MVNADDSPIDFVVDEERITNNDYQSMYFGHISGAPDTLILRI